MLLAEHGAAPVTPLPRCRRPLTLPRRRYATGVRAVPLSRMAVGAAFPAFTTSLLAVKSILLFNRAGIKDTEARWA